MQRKEGYDADHERRQAASLSEGAQYQSTDNRDRFLIVWNTKLGIDESSDWPKNAAQSGEVYVARIAALSQLSCLRPMVEHQNGQFVFFDYEPDGVDMATEVIEGLTSSPKFISPKYFYDQRGSELFEAITKLDDYYLMRTELELFSEHFSELAALLRDNLCVIEYGSGSSLKIRKLLEALAPVAYVPIDISQEHLLDNARALHQDFPWLDIYPVCADFAQPLALPKVTAGLNKLGFFPGSSVSNFEPAAACAFLKTVSAELRPGGSLLIGVDRKKPADILNRAYNDSEGVTAEFNRNVLLHVNKRLDATFDVKQFRHEARYNDLDGCIQMFLRSAVEQIVEVNGQFVKFAEDEELLTENSYKFHPEEFLALATEAGFAVVRQWTDKRNWYSLFLLEVA